MNKIDNAKNKQTIVFVDIGSLKIIQLNIVNTIAPILNPISLEGHN
jgi:hypothetical protein